MGGKSSVPVLQPPPHYHPPPLSMDDGWMRRAAPLSRGPAWAGSRMSLVSTPIHHLPYAVDDHMIVLPPDPKMLKKIHKEQKRMLKRMRGLPVEVIVAPVGTGELVSGHESSIRSHPSLHQQHSFSRPSQPPHAYSIDHINRDSLYTAIDRRPHSQRSTVHHSEGGWGGGSSLGPHGSLDSPLTSSAGSHTVENGPMWRRERRTTTTHTTHTQQQPHANAFINRSGTYGVDNGGMREQHFVHAPHTSSHPPRPRSLWMHDGIRSRSTAGMQHMGGNERSTMSSGSSDRLGGSTGDIDFSWVREEEGRLRDKERWKNLPECYFGMETDVGQKKRSSTGKKTRDENANDASSATAAMAF